MHTKARTQVAQSSQMKIELTDNNKGQKNTDKDTAKFDRSEIADLFPIAGKKIEDLCKDYSDLLIFPQCLKNSDDLNAKEPIFTIDSTNHSEEVRITTGNVMGFIGVKDVQLKIKSRFDDGREDNFLHYMLQKVFSFNIFDLHHSSAEEGIFDFLLFLFPCLLNNAMRQGIYKEYRRYQHNDTNVKGTIDVSRHIARNNPFVGNVAYTTREYAHDNNMTQLIRHTIEYIKSKEFGQSVLSKDKDTKDNVKSIVAYTPSYRKSERSAVISKNLRFKSHPYYTDYLPLQRLCLQILRHEQIKYGERNDEIHGILFDGAWLWEEYVNILLSKKEFKHPENRKEKGYIYLFEDNTGRRYPDFYKEDFVLDAKYKRLGSYVKVSDVGRDDIHQLITYMTRLKATKGGFVAPLVERQLSVPCSKLKNAPLTLSIFGIEICCAAESFEDFYQAMQQNESDFLKSLEE